LIMRRLNIFYKVRPYGFNWSRFAFDTPSSAILFALWPCSKILEGRVRQHCIVQPHAPRAKTRRKFPLIIMVLFHIQGNRAVNKII
jgi:hypothetical protein